MVSYSEIRDTQKEVSGLFSSQVRTLALGLLAIAWALLTAHDEPLRTMALTVPRWELLSLAVLSVFVLTFDLLQYVFALRFTRAALHKAEHSPTRDAKYDNGSFSYRAHLWMYHGKFSALVVAALLKAWVFLSLFRAPSAPSNKPLSSASIGAANAPESFKPCTCATDAVSRSAASVTTPAEARDTGSLGRPGERPPLHK